MRSLLFVPGDSERKLARGLASGADAVILDLEDSVGGSAKAAARDMVRAVVAEAKGKPSRPRLIVRINDLESDLWEADLDAVMPAGPDGVMLPKPRSGEDVHRLSIALHHAESRSGGETGTTRIIPIVTEVPVSILDLKTYIGSSTRLEGLTWGAEDLSAEIGAVATRGGDGRYTSPFRLARDLTLLTATAAEVAAIDSVFIDFRDGEGLALECAEAARDGFTGKLAIHPDQVATINAAFTPSGAEIARAEHIVAVFAANPSAGVAALDGRMVDRPHLKRAERLLIRAKAAGLVTAAPTTAA